MKPKKLPSQKYLNECFEYNKDTGDLIWKSRPISHFKSERSMKTTNTRFSGKAAGSVWSSDCGKRYVYIGINKTVYKAHRIIMLMMGFDVDAFEVDHCDGNGLNNSFRNLSLVDGIGNARNHRIQKNNTSGHSGVSFKRDASKWHAYIRNDGKRVNLGMFSSLEDAIKARKDAEKKYGYHKNHGSDRPL